MPTLRAVAGFLSLLALGLILAVACAFVVVGLSSRGAPVPASNGPRLDYVSLCLGLLLGVSIGQLARISWSEMPRRMANWLLVNERNFYRIGWAVILIGVLLYY